jgi:hypothetical protein
LLAARAASAGGVLSEMGKGGQFTLSGLEGGRRGSGCCRDCCRCGWASCWVRGSLLEGACLGVSQWTEGTMLGTAMCILPVLNTRGWPSGLWVL